mgnify:CR=1 FL=1|jgi:hypothetical protein
MSKKEKEEGKIPTWQLKGFECKKSYQGWLYFNGLVSEEIMYDQVYQDQFTGKTVNIEDY